MAVTVSVTVTACAAPEKRSVCFSLISAKFIFSVRATLYVATTLAANELQEKQKKKKKSAAVQANSIERKRLLNY